MHKHYTVKIATGPYREEQEYFCEQIARAGNLLDIDLTDSFIGTEHIYVWVPAEYREDAPRVVTSALMVAYGTTFNLQPNFG